MLQPWRKGNTGRPPKSAEPFLIDVATGCWVWQRAVSHKGYGLAWNGEKMQAAHRMYWERIRGPIPAGLQLDHKCRNRLCVNPDHLEPVTGQENTYRGNATKLSDAQVADVRARVARGESRVQVGREFGISDVHVGRIVRGARRLPSPSLPPRHPVPNLLGI